MSTACPFYHRELTSVQAEEKLRAAKYNGSFLIRDGSSPANSYCLCLLWSNTVYKYRILHTTEGLLYLESSAKDKTKTFSDLTSLVNFVYKKGDDNGMQCALSSGVKSEDFGEESDESDYSDDNDFIRAREQGAGTTPATQGLDAFAITADHTDGLAAELYSQVVDLHSTDRYSVSTIAKLLRSKVTQYAEESSKDAARCSVDTNQFVKSFDAYLSRGFEEDLRAMRSDSGSTGTTPMAYLHNFIGSEGKEALKSLSALCWKLNVLGRALDGGLSPNELKGASDGSSGSSSSSSNSYRALLNAVCDCKSLLLDADKNAVLLMESAVNAAAAVSAAEQVRPEETQSVSFEVRIRAGLKGFVQYIVDVEINAGKIGYVKCSSNSLDEKYYIQIQNVLQVIKDADNSTKLTVIVSDRKKELYAFSDARSREHFCQLVQQMKRMHTPTSDIEQISVFVGTWNIGYAEPPAANQGIPTWLHSSGLGKTQTRALDSVPHDLYAIGIQESALSEKEWLQRIRKSLQTMFNIVFHPVAACTLWAIKLIILVRPEHKNRIHHVTQDTVKTGIANALGNKGAAAVSFCFEGTSLCFVNAHLTANTERCERRNQNYRDIMRSLSCSPGGRPSTDLDVTHQFHHVFFFGDLNYRVDEDVNEAVRKADGGEYQKLFASDQLTKVKDQNKAFFGFVEEEITFAPTYRYRKGTVEQFHYRKEKKTGVKFNPPSWCDRVLWKSFPGLHIQNTSYGIVRDITVSDHKPMFSTFTIGIAASGSAINSDAFDSVSFDVLQIEAEIQTSQREPNVHLAIYSSCLAGPTYSQVIKIDWSTAHDGCTKVTFADANELKPVINDPTYIQEQYLVMVVKLVGDGLGGGEVFGACVVPLSNLFENAQPQFAYDLTHAGERTGCLRGVLKGKVARAGGSILKRGESFRRTRKSIVIVSSREMPLEKWDETVIAEEQPSADFAAGSAPSGGALPLPPRLTHQQPGGLSPKPLPVAVSPSTARRVVPSPSAPEQAAQPPLPQLPLHGPRAAARPPVVPPAEKQDCGSRAAPTLVGPSVELTTVDTHQRSTAIKLGGRPPVALPPEASIEVGVAAPDEVQVRPTVFKPSGRPPVALPSDASTETPAVSADEAPVRPSAIKPSGRPPMVVPQPRLHQRMPEQSGRTDLSAQANAEPVSSRWPHLGQ